MRALLGVDSERPRVWEFFKNSGAERRVSDGGIDFDLYPILGIRGTKALTYNGVAISGRTGDISTLSSEELARYFENQPDTVIVYLSFEAALMAAPDAHRTWQSATTIARLDWIHWIDSAKKMKTREKRIHDACEMLANGKKRVCCFNPSGFYNKAFKAHQPE